MERTEKNERSGKECTGMKKSVKKLRGLERSGKEWKGVKRNIEKRKQIATS